MKILSELTYSALDAVKVGDYFVYPKEGKCKVGLKVTLSYMIPMPAGPFETVQEAVAAAEVFEKRIEFPTNPGKPLEMPKTIVTCVYCGMEYPNGTPTAKAQILTDHIKVCTKHPMRAAEQRIKMLEDACREAIPCLKDWIQTTGCGEVCRRDEKALESIMIALKPSIKELNDKMVEAMEANTCDRCTLAFKVWSEDDVWDYRDVQALAVQLDMRQHYVKVGMPAIIKYKKMIDDEILMILDKVMRLPSDWHEDAKGPKDGMSKPYWKEGTECGSVKRICTIKSTFDIDEMRMPDNKAKFPSPEEVAQVLASAMNPIDGALSSRCRPDSKGFYYLSNVECSIKVEAYMVEMILYLYAVDFFGGEHG